MRNTILFRYLKKRSIFTLLCLATGFSLEAYSENQEFIPFDEFIQTVEKANYNTYFDHPLFFTVSDEEFQSMQKHILETYYLVKVKHSFILDGTGHTDCIDVNTQPGLRRGEKFLELAIPPKALIQEQREEEEKNSFVKPMLDAKKIDNAGNRVYCSEGTIPMARMELNKLFRYRTLADFFNKYGFAGENAFPEAKQK